MTYRTEQKPLLQKQQGGERSTFSSLKSLSKNFYFLQFSSIRSIQKSRCRMASGLSGIPFTTAARCVLVKPVPRRRGNKVEEVTSAFKFQKEKKQEQKHNFR